MAAKAMLAKPCSEKDYYSSTGTFQRCARSSYFECASFLVTVVFFVWMGIDCDSSSSSTLLEAETIFILVQWAFVGFYSFELCVRFMAFQSKGDAFKCFGFDFDVFLLLALIVASCVPAGNQYVILIQFARVGSLMLAVPELRVLLEGLATAFRSVLWCALLFALLIYLFGIFFTKIRARTPLWEDRFGSVPKSMWTLWTHGILIGSPGDLAQAIGEKEGGGAAFLFVLFILMSLSVLVVTAGALCQVVGAVASAEAQKMTAAYMAEALRSAQCSSAFWASKEGFLDGLQAKPGAVLQKKLGMDLEELAEFADVLFALGGFASLEELAGEISSIGMPGFSSDGLRKDVRRDLVRLERRLLPDLGNCSPAGSESTC